ncbi:hypothetical protein O3G_MSEX010405 [Manduca sexta]|uniref:Sperm microtubule inner protein 1 C-terminal domain-containing protein n=2 Tax=Manduca sexta TaxID=7130 RepID=A0A921ZHP2_MANSE|nr:hypothetical protein O3G_MSEX010405 [Manduca sexta]
MDISDPAVIIFLVESYEKENRLRLNWITKHREKIEQAATLTRPPTNYFESDVTAHPMVAGMGTVTISHAVAGYNRRKKPIRDATFIPGIKYLRKGHSIVDIGLGDPKLDSKLVRPDTDLSSDPIMRPVDPELTQIIYKSKPEFGNMKYMEERGKILPEKRYYFAESSGWTYGWRLGDSTLKEKPMYGRCWHLTKTLKSRVGPQPDPAHYKSSVPPGRSHCDGI